MKLFCCPGRGFKNKQRYFFFQSELSVSQILYIFITFCLVLQQKIKNSSQDSSKCEHCMGNLWHQQFIIDLSFIICTQNVTSEAIKKQQFYSPVHKCWPKTSFYYKYCNHQNTLFTIHFIASDARQLFFHSRKTKQRIKRLRGVREFVPLNSNSYNKIFEMFTLKTSSDKTRQILFPSWFYYVKKDLKKPKSLMILCSQKIRVSTKSKNYVIRPRLQHSC